MNLEEAGQAAVAEAKRLWQTDIIDPKRGAKGYDREINAIDAFIRGTGGLGWTWEDRYAGDGDFEWCGAFAAWCWAKGGLAAGVRYNFLSSTYRLDRYARYKQANERVPNPKPATGPYRMIIDLHEHSVRDVRFSDGTAPRAGDILMIGLSGYGQHICLVDHYDAMSGVFHTIEGNGTGIGPRGNRMQGIVRGERLLGSNPGRTVFHGRRLIRVAPHDLG